MDRRTKGIASIVTALGLLVGGSITAASLSAAGQEPASVVVMDAEAKSAAASAVARASADREVSVAASKKAVADEKAKAAKVEAEKKLADEKLAQEQAEQAAAAAAEQVAVQAELDAQWTQQQAPGAPQEVAVAAAPVQQAPAAPAPAPVQADPNAAVWSGWTGIAADWANPQPAIDTYSGWAVSSVEYAGIRKVARSHTDDQGGPLLAAVSSGSVISFDGQLYRVYGVFDGRVDDTQAYQQAQIVNADLMLQTCFWGSRPGQDPLMRTWAAVRI